MANVAELIVKIRADTSDAQKGMDDAASKTSKFGAGLQKAAVPAAAALVAVGAAAVGAAQAAADDEQAQAILANTMKKTTGAHAAQIKSMEDYISKTSEATGVTDDELRPAMGKLLRATGDAAKSQDAMTQALDISAATGKDVGTVSEALAKAYGGSTGSLKKLVPSLDDATLKSGNMKKIMGELAEQTGGAAAVAADTAAGKMKKMRTSMGEAQEEMGSALLPVMAKFADLMATVAKWIGDNTTLFYIIIGVISGIAAAIVVANAAIAIYNAVTLIAGAVSGAAWLAALGPILLVIAAVAAVIVIIVILWKKSETFRDIVTGVWHAIKSAAQATMNWIKGAWSGLIEGIKSAAGAMRDFVANVWNSIRDKARDIVDAVKDFFRALWDRIVEIAQTRVENLKNNFDKIRDKARDIVDAVKDFFRGMWDFAVELAQQRVENLKNNIQKIRDKVSEIVEGIKTLFRDMWTNIVNSIPPGLGETLSKPFTVAKGAVDKVTTAIGWLIEKVQSLIDWLGKIHVPKIHIPGTGKSVAAPTVPSVARFAAPGVASTRATSTPTSSPSVSIVVNGALDPEATARQIRRILAGHDRRVGLVGA